MIVISQELYIFFSSVWTGCIIYGIYLASRLVCRLNSGDLRLTNIMDFIFWVINGVYILEQIHQLWNGIIRWYCACGVLLGVTISYLLWKVMLQYLEKIKKYLIKDRKRDTID